jgi:hypothetical protein
LDENIKITIDQIYTLSDEVGDVKFVELEEDDDGNIVAKFDGLEDEQIMIGKDGEVLEREGR